MNNIWIIAQAGDGDATQQLGDETYNPGSDTSALTSTSQDGSNNGGQQGQDQQEKPPGFPIWLLGLMMVFMFFIIFRPQQKQKQQQKKLEQSLEKNDRIVTIGGIYGTIVEIKDDEVTLKVDESNNTKIKVVRKSIARNMSKD